MKKRLLLLLTLILCVSVTACTSRGGQTETQSLAQSDAESRPEKTVQEDAGSRPGKTAQETEGTEIYRDFRVDNVFHSDSEGDIHYNIYIPETYDGTKPYALYFTLPGYGGLYFQGVAANIKTEEFGFEAMKYNEEMIIVAPQLNDWGETSADQTIALAEYFLEQYNIDRDRVYGSGYSGGGETMSLVLGKRPDLFTAYLHVSSKWDGAYEPVIEQELPVYLAIGRNDEYYGSEQTQEAYNALYALYEQKGFDKEKIDGLLVLDIKEHEYFTQRGISNEHGGGGLFARDTEIMGWLFQATKEPSHGGSINASLSGTVPAELEYIPDKYKSPSEHPGTLEKLTYQTWESFSYEEKTQELTKEAWVYLPYGYSENQEYNVFYLSHGGWSNETTTMGTDQNPRSFKHVIDHAIEDGKIQPLIIVLPTYNNTSGRDSGDYSLALRLTDRFHNELVNDLIPAVESRYSTYAEDTTQEGLKASRNHRGFGGFSMGSVNTWCTFRYALDYFRYFMPMSGSYSTDGEYMAELVKESGHDSDDFFIFAASGTDDFAYSAFKTQIMAMGSVSDGTFRFADNEADGNLSFLEREGYVHDAIASDEYTYNGLRFFWNREQ